jgi:hypothetical protein
VPARKKGLCKTAQDPLNIDEKNVPAALQQKIGPSQDVALVHRPKHQTTDNYLQRLDYFINATRAELQHHPAR